MSEPKTSESWCYTCPYCGQPVKHTEYASHVKDCQYKEPPEEDDAV